MSGGIEQLKRRTEKLETTHEQEKTVLSVEKRGYLELVKWGNLIVKMLRGVSMDDL